MAESSDAVLTKMMVGLGIKVDTTDLEKVKKAIQGAVDSIDLAKAASEQIELLQKETEKFNKKTNKDKDNVTSFTEMGGEANKKLESTFTEILSTVRDLLRTANREAVTDPSYAPIIAEIDKIITTVKDNTDDFNKANDKVMSLFANYIKEVQSGSADADAAFTALEDAVRDFNASSDKNSSEALTKIRDIIPLVKALEGAIGQRSVGVQDKYKDILESLNEFALSFAEEDEKMQANSKDFAEAVRQFGESSKMIGKKGEKTGFDRLLTVFAGVNDTIKSLQVGNKDLLNELKAFAEQADTNAGGTVQAYKDAQKYVADTIQKSNDEFLKLNQTYNETLAAAFDYDSKLKEGSPDADKALETLIAKVGELQAAMEAAIKESDTITLETQEEIGKLFGDVSKDTQDIKDSFDALKDKTDEIVENIQDNAEKIQKSVDTMGNKVDSSSEKMKKEAGKKGDNSILNAVKSVGEKTKEGIEGADKASQGLLKIMGTVRSALEKVANTVIEASPILKAVRDLFNLAMRLFFMPIGNKIGEELIPRVVELVQEAVEFWDELEGDDGLEAIVERAMDYFIKMISDWFKDIGSTLESHSGLLGSIGHLINTLGTWVEKLPPLLSVVVTAMDFVMSNITQIINLVIGFKTASLTMQAAQLAATIAAAGLKGAGAALAAGAVIAGGSYAVGTGISASLDGISSATGGSVSNINIVQNGVVDMDKTITVVSGRASSRSQTRK